PDQTLQLKTKILFEKTMKKSSINILAFGPAANFKESYNTTKIDHKIEDFFTFTAKNPDSLKTIPLINHDSASSIMKTPGGIDLNPDAMNLSVTSDTVPNSGNHNPAHAGVPFTISPEQLASLQANLHGLRPVIVSINQHARLPAFLEL
ncbi:MAG: hypothetical protein WCI27_07365, partial [Candidatus Omnitrophota bacterium]